MQSPPTPDLDRLIAGRGANAATDDELEWRRRRRDALAAQLRRRRLAAGLAEQQTPRRKPRRDPLAGLVVLALFGVSALIAFIALVHLLAIAGELAGAW